MIQTALRVARLLRQGAFPLARSSAQPWVRLGLESLEGREVPSAAYYPLANGPFTQNWSDTGTITSNDDWSGVPSIIGYTGAGLTSGTGVDPRTLTADVASPVDVNANQTSPNLFSTAGVAEFHLIDPVVALQGGGSAKAPHLVLHLDTTGVGDVALSFTLPDLDGSTDNALSQVAVQYRAGDTGSWQNVTGGYVADATGGPSQNALVTPVSVTIPAVPGGLLQVRIMTTDSAGTDEWIGVDDIVAIGSALVTVANVSDATEGGSNGMFRFTRTGDTSAALTVNYSVGGTATSGTDYTALGGTVTFAASAATADVAVAAATDSVYDPDETVAVTVTSGAGYSIGGGASATVTIEDDVETVETLIHQQTFQLTGPSGSANVSLTVTYNAPGAPGLYKWVYTVTNTPETGSPLTTFEVPIDGMDSDVANLASSLGWTGTIGVSGVSWAAGVAPALSFGTATFSFTTAPREVGNGDIGAGSAGGYFVDLPVAPAPREKTAAPYVLVAFGNKINKYDMRIDITTADGSSFTTGFLSIYEINAADARDSLYALLKINGYAVEKSGGGTLLITGRVAANGTSIVAIKSLGYKYQNITTGMDYSPPPALVSRTNVTVGVIP